LIEAYYAESPGPVVEFATRYGVDLFLVNRRAFDPATFALSWTYRPNGRWEPYTSTIARRLQGPQRFALLDLASRCAVVEASGVAVVPTSCLRGA